MSLGRQSGHQVIVTLPGMVCLHYCGRKRYSDIITNVLLQSCDISHEHLLSLMAGHPALPLFVFGMQTDPLHPSPLDPHDIREILENGKFFCFFTNMVFFAIFSLTVSIPTRYDNQVTKGRRERKAHISGCPEIHEVLFDPVPYGSLLCIY